MWFLPSRARPAGASRFFKAYRDTGASTPGVLWLDADDPSEYELSELPNTWKAIVEPRHSSLGAMTNAFFDTFEQAPWFGVIADDAVPVTEGWDMRLVEAAGSDGVAWGADGINNGKQFTHGVIGGDLVREMGWLILPGLHRLYGDNVWTEIGRRRGVLRYQPDVVIEHWHFSNGKSPYDETYAKPDSGGDKAIFDWWLASLDKVAA